MKHGKRPTKRQKIAIEAAGSNPHDWLIVKSLQGQMHVVHRHTDTKKIILL